MKQPKIYVNEKYLYIKKDSSSAVYGTIFDIRDYTDGDSCAMLLTEATFIDLHMLVKGGEYGTSGTKLYFDDFVERGDTVMFSGSTKHIYKTIHSGVATSEDKKGFKYYYQDLCIEELRNLAYVHYDMPYEEFLAQVKRGAWGFPAYMISGNGIYTCDAQINLTEDKYNEYKRDALAKQALEAVNGVIEPYGKTATLEIKTTGAAADRGVIIKYPL